MAKSEFLKAGAVATIAALLALAATPSSAMAQDRGHGRQGREGAAATQSQSRPAWRGSSEARQQRARPQERAAPPQRARPQERAAPPQRARPQERAAPPQRARPEARTESGGSPAWRGRGRDSETARPERQQNQARERRAEQPRMTPPQGSSPSIGSRPDRNPNWSRPEASRPAINRPETSRPEASRPSVGHNNDRWDNNRNGWQSSRPNNNWGNQNRDRDRNGWKAGRRDEPVHSTPSRRDDDRRWSYNNGRYNWNRDWRHDGRYDWNNHRRNYRNIYNIGRYHAPYSSYYYRPLSIGFRLNTLFYGNNYWISDPWEYRLPQAYGPYRWVRYYDDVLLVNIQDGTVVDVIRNFFW